MTSFFEVYFSRSSSWLTSELLPTVITTSLELIRHLFNFLSYFKYHLPKSKLTSLNESASLMTETKAGSNYDVIEGNEAIWCRCYWSAGCYVFLNLTKIECIVGELFKNKVKFVSVNSFVCWSYFSLGTFLNRFPLHIIRRENSAFPNFASFPGNFLKESQRAKEGKVLNCTHTLLLRKTSEKGTEK